MAIVAALGLPAIELGPALADQGTGGWFNFGGARSSGGAQPYDAESARDYEANPPIGRTTLSRANIKPTDAAIKRYAKIVSKGGWKRIPIPELRPGARGESVAFLRRRLEVTGDLVSNGNRRAVYDYYVEQAVRYFQMRHGLTPTGIATKRTMMALNVSASARLKQLRRNRVRVNSLSRSAAKRYIVVNIPAAQIEAVENDRVVSRHAAVVGKIDRRTPILRSRVHQINFNPYWNVPASIVRKDLVPKARQYARQGKDVLNIYKIEAFDGRGRKLNSSKINWSSSAVFNYRYRQLPWKDNSMGFVKINFHNRHAVYMHDTPSKSLFKRNFRAHSSGCVRVQNVGRLVTWILGANAGWGGDRVEEMRQTGERRDVRVKRGVPVYFVYVTAWATPDGTTHFRRDLYLRDGVGVAAAKY